jgi:hypothetical protein
MGVTPMDCPFCGYDIEKDSSKIDSESGVWKAAYECPNCMRKFKKKTLLNKGAGYAVNASVWLLLAALSGDGDGGGDCEEVVAWEEMIEIDSERLA